MLKFLKNKKTKKVFLSLLLVGIIFSGLVLSCNLVKAQSTSDYYMGDMRDDLKGWGEEKVVEKVQDGVFGFFGKIINVSGVILQIAVDPRMATGETGLFEKYAVQTGWMLVRDFMNLAFIMVLLFSAFATIFQIEKFHLRNVLIKLLIFALLINFSMPITRFVVDASNVIMYFFINQFFGPDLGANAAGKAGGVTASILDASNFGNIFEPKNFSDNKIAYTITMLIFTALMALTVLAVAGIMLIRLIALAVLMIFSPIGFIAGLIPGTSGLAQSFWQSLFRYAFMGPILMFVLAISKWMMVEVNNDNKVFVKDAASNHTAMAADFIGSITYLFIPLVILWVGIMSSAKLGVAGAGLATGLLIGAKGKALGWAKTGAKKVGWKGAAVGSAGLLGGAGLAGGAAAALGLKKVLDKTGWTGGAKEAWKDKFPWTKEKREKAQRTREAKRAETFGVKGARERLIAEKRESLIKTPNREQWRNNLADDSKVDDYTKAASALEMVKAGMSFKATEFNNAMKSLEATPGLQGDLISAMHKKNRVDLIVGYEIEKGKKPMNEIIEDNLKLSPDGLSKQTELITDGFLDNPKHAPIKEYLKGLDVEAKTEVRKRLVGQNKDVWTKKIIAGGGDQFEGGGGI